MFLVCRVLKSIQQIVKTGDAPAILRGTGKFAIGTYRVDHVGSRLQAFLKDNAVLPSVAKIVGVESLSTGSAEEIANTHLALISDIVGHELVFRIQWAKTPAPSEEFMPMAILPSHRNLQHVM